MPGRPRSAVPQSVRRAVRRRKPGCLTRWRRNGLTTYTAAHYGYDVAGRRIAEADSQLGPTATSYANALPGLATTLYADQGTSETQRILNAFDADGRLTESLTETPQGAATGHTDRLQRKRGQTTIS